MCPLPPSRTHRQSGATLAEVLVALLLLSLSLLPAAVMQWQSLDQSFQALAQSEQQFLDSSRYELQRLGVTPDQAVHLLAMPEPRCGAC